MNDGENIGAIVAGTVTPFILLVTVSALILVCWRWYTHSQCYFCYNKFFFSRYTRRLASIPNVSSITCKPINIGNTKNGKTSHTVWAYLTSLMGLCSASLFYVRCVCYY